MLRPAAVRTLLLAVCAALLLTAVPASAAVSVTPPAAGGDPVRVDGSVLPESVTVRVSGGRLRISDPSGATLQPGGALVGGLPACAQQSLLEVTCDATLRAVLALAEGNDQAVVGEALATSVDGGAGTDTVSYASYAGNALVVDLAAGVNQQGAGLQRLEVVEGSPGRDRLTGSWAAETLRGAGSRDTLDGGAGTDVLDGGDGDDTISAVDGAPDALACRGGRDTVSIDTADVDDGACEVRQGPGAAPPVVIAPPPAPAPPPPPAPIRRPRPTVVKPGQGIATIVSGPAADGANTRIGARVRGRAAGTVALVVAHGDREVGRSEGRVGAGGETVLSVPLDDAVRRQVAETRHVELAVTVETTYDGAAPVAEQRQVTLLEPPPFVRGTTGVSRHGGFGPERLAGTGRGDVLSGASGDDRLLGRAGNDRFDGGTGNDRLAGAAGDDLLDGFDGDDLLLGGAGDDLLIESRFGDDTLDGGAGDDWIVGARGTDTIRGGTGDDVIFGGPAPDRIDCGPGEDTAFVNLESEKRSARGCETILEEDDIPSIRCGDGEGTDNGETMLGTGGADVCRGHGGADDVEGAGGHDRLDGGTGDDRVFGRFGDDVLTGDAGDDELEGGRGRDRLDGGAGNDQLNGGYDRDVLDGGPGDDVLIARGGGRDALDCGPGRDVAYADRGDRVRGCESIRRR